VVRYGRRPVLAMAVRGLCWYSWLRWSENTLGARHVNAARFVMPGLDHFVRVSRVCRASNWRHVLAEHCGRSFVGLVDVRTRYTAGGGQSGTDPARSTRFEQPAILRIRVRTSSWAPKKLVRGWEAPAESASRNTTSGSCQALSLLLGMKRSVTSCTPRAASPPRERLRHRRSYN
jgi:hypothetical protein